jgi:prepilin-type N-terminal cleavage/methylation domain-containing protein/prepilin-type processing-associated H-X9-DG protein
MKRFLNRRKGFTLVELLVVIGIIALLIGILLPALNRARQSAASLLCLSNVRQLALAATMFAQEHHGRVPPCSDNALYPNNDPYKQNFSYRDNGTGVDELQDWASALLRYMGDRTLTDFQKAPTNKTKVYLCPSDPYLSDALPGYCLVNDVTNSVSKYQAVSYGYNADIACLIDTGGHGLFANDKNYLSIYKGPVIVSPYGQPLNCLIGKVYKSSDTLLFADCGNRPEVADAIPLDGNDVLYYSSNGISPQRIASPGTLLGISQQTPLNLRIPYTRHHSKINIAFVDGHAESLGSDQFHRVRVSPFCF